MCVLTVASSVVVVYSVRLRRPMHQPNNTSSWLCRPCCLCRGREEEEEEKEEEEQEEEEEEEEKC